MTGGRSEHRSVAVGVGVGAVMLLCCAGPALAAAGVLGILGAVLVNPVVIATAVLLAAAAAAWLVQRHRHRSSSADLSCCPPHDRLRS